MIKEKRYVSKLLNDIFWEKNSNIYIFNISTKPPGQKVFTNCQPAFLKHIFRAGRSGGYRESDTILPPIPSPRPRPHPPLWFTRGQGLRFTLHLYRFVDTPRLTDCVDDGGREGGPGWIFTREVFFWVGFWVFPGVKWSYKMRRKSCFKIGDSEILNKNGLKQLLKNCKKPNVERATRTILTQISSCCSDLHYWWKRQSSIMEPVLCHTLHRFLRFLDDLLRLLDGPVILQDTDHHLTPSLSPLIEKFCWSSMKPSHKKRKTTTSSSKCHQQKDTFSYCQCFLMIYICYPSMNDPKVSSFFSRTTWTSIPPLPPPLFRGWSILLRGQQFWNIGVKGVPFRWGYVVVAAGGKHGGFFGGIRWLAFFF